MSNPLAAVGGIAAQAPGAPSPAAAFNGLTVNAGALAEQGGPSGAGEAFNGLLHAFQSETAGFETASGPGFGADPVSAAKTDFVSGAVKEGQAVTLAPVTPGDPAAGLAGARHDGGVTVLRKSFDHAIFVTLVSQIVSGVSQAVTTLVKQQ